jgi:hypothetical protein
VTDAARAAAVDGPDFDTPLVDDEYFAIHEDGHVPKLHRSPDFCRMAHAMKSLTVTRVHLSRSPAAPLSEEDPRASLFQWMIDNPQSAAFVAVLTANLLPNGPNLWASVAHAAHVEGMADARNPDYRYPFDVNGKRIAALGSATREEGAGELDCSCGRTWPRDMRVKVEGA